MCPFKKAVPLALLLHLLMVVGIIGANAQRDGHIFTMLPASGQGQVLSAGRSIGATQAALSLEVLQVDTIAPHTAAPVASLATSATVSTTAVPQPIASPRPTLAPSPQASSSTSTASASAIVATQISSLTQTALPSTGAIAASGHDEPAHIGGAIATRSTGGRITPPIALHRPRPARPSGATRGEVVAIFTITARGQVADITIERSPSDTMSQAVLAILPRWRFTPAKENGQAIELRVRQVVQF